MVTMSAMARTGPLFVAPLSSLCARRVAKASQKHGRLLRLESACGARFERVVCGLERSECARSGVWLDRTLEALGRRSRKALPVQWEERRWTRAWTGQNLTWNEEQSPYETLGVERDADEDSIKGAYRRMAKQFHPDVYDERNGELKEGETPESYFIQIQAAYELLMNRDQRRQYDLDHRTNPLKASTAWMDWVIKKRKSFDQRGEMAASAWAEQQMREMNLKARRAARNKVDPEEERRILAREKAVSAANFENTIRRQALVLKKRDIMNRKAREEAQKRLVQQLLEAEGLELDDEQS
ncbi:hypothetical protein M758_4G070900 [Ceratodon purpureus]|nr:hypothetical protein M758_4G070900 [Ceratodon purpureus]